MNGEPSHDPQLDENDPRDPLWQLLGQAPRPEPDAWFTARTMARCRNEGLGSDDRVGGRMSWGAFSRIWRWALGGGLAFCMAVALVVQNQAQPEQADNQQKVQEAFEIVASMDTDSDSASTPSSWQDTSR
jgi:hypothetical protein